MTLTNFPYDPILDLAPWVGQRQSTFRFELKNRVSGIRLGEITPIRTAELSHDTSRTIKRQMQLALGKDDTAEINPVSDMVSPFMVFPDGTEYALGEYVFTDASYQRFTSGELSSMTLNDQMFIVDQQIEKGFSVLRTVSGGLSNASSIPTCVTALLADQPVRFDIENSPFGSADTWSAGTTRGSILESLALTGDYFCLAPETPILTADLKWERVDSLKLGQEIVGFDESDSGSSQRYRRATVDSLACRTLPSFEILTEFGPVTASADHMWLTKTPKVRHGGFHRKWKRTADLQRGDRIVSFGQPWKTDDSRDAGYIAGVFDGEGSLAIPGGRGAHTSKIPRVTFGQNPGIVLDKVKSLLSSKGFDFRETQPKKLRLHHLVLRGGKYESMRFLGTMRPERLLSKADSLWEGRATWSVADGHDNSTSVLDVIPVGDRHVIAIGTSTKTLVANGLLSHNSPWFGHDGVLHFIRAFNPALRIPDLDWDNGNQVLRASILRNNNVLTAPNRFVVISNAPEDTSIATYGVANVPQTAPHSIQNRGFVVPSVIDIQALSSIQCSAIASNLVQRQTVFETTSLTTAPDPRHDSYNVIKWQGELWLELAWSITMREGAPMSHTIRKAYQ